MTLYSKNHWKFVRDIKNLVEQALLQYISRYRKINRCLGKSLVEKARKIGRYNRGTMLFDYLLEES